jgi:hypothetical protein
MQNTAWIALFGRIPVAIHDCLIIKTDSGSEIVLQRLIRLDRDFLVALGRFSGSVDQPKILIVPYSHMTYLAINKNMTEEEIQGAIGRPGAGESIQELPAPPEANAARTNAQSLEQVEIIDFPRQSPPAAAPEAPPAPSSAEPFAERGAPRVVPPSKSILLARLRQRLANENVNR